MRRLLSPEFLDARFAPLAAIDFGETNLPFALNCALDVVIVVAALASRRPLALVGALAVLALKGLALMALGLDDLGVSHVLWLDLVIVLPVAGVAAFVLFRRPLALLALLAVLLGVYASFVEPARLVVERATVDVPGDGEVRVGVISDLQFEHVGAHEREAVARLVRERPDLILVPGDFHQGTAETFFSELPAIRRLLRGLRAPAGVFAVQGDVENVPKLRAVLEGTGVTGLVNETAAVTVRGRRIVVGGVERDFASPTAQGTARELGAARGTRILLAHRPDVVLGLGAPVDLVVAGHTHGGQVQLPLLGPPVTLSAVPRSVGAGGLHRVEGRRIYVSRGVGVERGQAPKLRFRSVPEVAVLTLR